jgi:hypothetical protein
LKHLVHFNTNHWYYLALGGLCILLPFLASRMEKPAPLIPTLPADFPAAFTQYATVQRPDGTLRDLYINTPALAAYGGGYDLPDGSILVITGCTAQQDSAGKWITDQNGRYTCATAFDSLHLRAKRRDWPDSAFPGDDRNGDWNYGSFTPSGAAFAEPITPCFQCHNTAEQPDFTYTFRLLAEYWRTQQVIYSFCDQTGRTPC